MCWPGAVYCVHWHTVYFYLLCILCGFIRDARAPASDILQNAESGTFETHPGAAAVVQNEDVWFWCLCICDTSANEIVINTPL